MGVGNGTLGQVINLPQWVVSYPNASLRSRAASARPTPMVGFLPQCGSWRPGGAMPTRRGAFSQRCLHFRSDTVTLRTPLRLRNYPSTAAAGPAFQ